MLDDLNDPLAIAVGSTGSDGGGQSEREGVSAAQRDAIAPMAPHMASAPPPPQLPTSLSAFATDDNAAWKAEVERMVQNSLPSAAAAPPARPPAAHAADAAAAPNLDDEEALLLQQLEAIRAKKAAGALCGTTAHAAR